MISRSRKSCIPLESWPRMNGTPPPVTVALTGSCFGIASSSAAVRMNDAMPPQISAQPHRARHLPAGVLGLLGDVAGRLEAVEDVDRREHRDQRAPASQCPPKSSAERVARACWTPWVDEQEAEPVVEAVDRQDDRDAEGADDLDVHAELRDPAHHLGAGDVERGLDREQDHRDRAGSSCGWSGRGSSRTSCGSARST